MIVDRSFLLQLEILSSPLQSQQVYLVLSWICYLRIFISHHTIFVKIWRFMIMFDLSSFSMAKAIGLKNVSNLYCCLEKLSGLSECFSVLNVIHYMDFQNLFLRVIRAERWNTLFIPTAQITCLNSSSRRLINGSIFMLLLKEFSKCTLSVKH